MSQTSDNNKRIAKNMFLLLMIVCSYKYRKTINKNNAYKKCQKIIIKIES